MTAERFPGEEPGEYADTAEGWAALNAEVAAARAERTEMAMGATCGTERVEVVLFWNRIGKGWDAIVSADTAHAERCADAIEAWARWASARAEES